MEAKVSYNDLKGTIAADVVDSQDKNYSLNHVFKDSDVNFKQYDIIGIHYFHAKGIKFEGGIFNISLLVQDKIDKTIKRKEVSVSIEDFIGSFKQFSFILTERFFDHSEIIYEKIESLD